MIQRDARNAITVPAIDQKCSLKLDIAVNYLLMVLIRNFMVRLLFATGAPLLNSA